MDGNGKPNYLSVLIDVARTLVRQFEEQEGILLPPGAMIWPFAHLYGIENFAETRGVNL